MAQQSDNLKVTPPVSAISSSLDIALEEMRRLLVLCFLMIIIIGIWQTNHMKRCHVVGQIFEIYVQGYTVFMF